MLHFLPAHGTYNHNKHTHCNLTKIATSASRSFVYRQDASIVSSFPRANVCWLQRFVNESSQMCRRMQGVWQGWLLGCRLNAAILSALLCRLAQWHARLDMLRGSFQPSERLPALYFAPEQCAIPAAYPTCHCRRSFLLRLPASQASFHCKQVSLRSQIFVEGKNLGWGGVDATTWQRIGFASRFATPGITLSRQNYHFWRIAFRSLRVCTRAYNEDHDLTYVDMWNIVALCAFVFASNIVQDSWKYSEKHLS